MCDDCDDDEDCYYVVPQVPTNSCAKGRCIEGRCVEEKHSPVFVCGGLLPPDEKEAHCYGGQCCYTCLYDLGNVPGSIDAEDGPCAPGVFDTACGFGGGLCQDCTTTGQVCVRGECADP